MSAVATLRARTSTAHDRVDAAYSAYVLHDEVSYRCFLLAHARALPAADSLASRAGGLAMSRPRTALLARDLAAFGHAMPIPLSFPNELGRAAAWGAFYVLEGSRLGGRLLAERVPARLPAAYLHAIHEPGEWRAIRDAIEAEAATHDTDWLDRAVTGALACFDLYARAAAASPP